MAGSLDGDIRFFLQRKTGTGAWTTIDTSTNLSATLPDPDTGTDTDSGILTATFNAATLNWSTAAQYRILIRKNLTDSSTSTAFSAAEGRTQSVTVE